MKAMILAALLLTGCTQKTNDDDLSPNRDGLPVVVDPDTWCQYLGFTNHGLTPRMRWDRETNTTVHMGCNKGDQPPQKEPE